MDAVEFVKDHSTCIVHWAQYYRTLCPPGQDRFYCYQASAKLLKVSKSSIQLFVLLN